MSNCPLCGTGGGVCFDRRAHTPILLNRTYKTAADARAAATGTLAITGCTQCGFVWNAAFDESAIVYDGEYENDQAHSGVFRAHLDDMAARVLKALPPGEILHVVEVGAGQGVFLKNLADNVGKDLGSATGFDPAWRGKPGAGPAPVRLYADLFDPQTAARLPHPPNVIVSRHTIEHVPQPLQFLGAIRDALPTNATIRIAVETPCVQWIFDNWAIQDFFYEHCSLFTAETLALTLKQSGFEPLSVAHVFDGQYLWAEGRAAPNRGPVSWSNARNPDFVAWSKRKDDMLARWRIFLDKSAAAGPVYVWGAGAKGITFACIFDPDAKQLTGLVDINPNKQRTHAAMTGCPILGPDAILGPRPTIIVMNPNYQDEVRRTCTERGLAPVIAIFGPEGPP
jgi:hypothetical protein